jgi:rhamnosyltransferase
MWSIVERNPIASVIILTKNNSKDVGICLKGVFDQELKQFEVIVIDSGSSDGTVDIASTFNVRVENINPTEFHHGRTRNLGASLAKGRFIVFLAPDAYPVGSTWLRNLIAPFADAEVAATYGRQIPKHDTNPIEQFFLQQIYPETKKTYSRRDLDEGNPERIVLLSDVCSALRKDVWETLRFDEKIIMSEDQEIARRILKEGLMIVYEPKCQVYHSHNYSLIDVFRRYFDSGESMTEIMKSTVSPSRSLGYAFRLLKGSIIFALQNQTERKLYWVIYSFAYNFLKVLGFMCGTRKRSIPPFLLEWLSHTRYRISLNR